MNLKDAIYKKIPEKYKYNLLRLWFFLNNPQFIFRKYSGSANEAQPILVISLPRSGSSWVGKMLGSAEDALYLREPITRTYLLKHPKGQSAFTLNSLSNKAVRQDYMNTIDTAFNGHPNFVSSVVARPRQWFKKESRRRTQPRRVIKEVNPLILGYMLTAYKPKVIFLYRHPAAIANSHFVSGWERNAFAGKFSEAELSKLKQTYNLQEEGEFWQSFGQFQCILQKLVLNELEQYGDKMVICYETLCDQPIMEFRKIFEFSGLDFSTEMIEKITNSTMSNNKAYTAGTYDTKRDSKAMISKWKSQLSKEDLTTLKSAYLSNKPQFYNSDIDWI